MTARDAAKLAEEAGVDVPEVDAEVVRLAGVRDDVGFASIGEVALKGMSVPIEAFEAKASAAN